MTRPVLRLVVEARNAMAASARCGSQPSSAAPSNVVIFTPIRPQEYVDRVAQIFLGYPQAKAEQLLAMEMAVITDKLVALGADRALIAREVRKLENSIRTAMWHLVMGTTP